MPVHATRNAACGVGLASAAAILGIIRGMYVAGNTQTKRSTMTVTSTAMHDQVMRAVDRSLLLRSLTIDLICRPISRKTAFSRTYEIVVQLVRSNSRDDADWMRGDLCPSTTPATTTASTPDGCESRPWMWISSAGR